MRQKSFAALAVPALTLSSLLAGCKHQGPEVPQPHCAIPATVRSFVTPDSCRGFVLELAAGSRTLLRPSGQLWQAFLPQARNGRRVFIEYVASADSSALGCPARLGRAGRLTCLSADTARATPKLPVIPGDTVRVPRAPRDTVKIKP